MLSHEILNPYVKHLIELAINILFYFKDMICYAISSLKIFKQMIAIECEALAYHVWTIEPLSFLFCEIVAVQCFLWPLALQL